MKLCYKLAATACDLHLAWLMIAMHPTTAAGCIFQPCCFIAACMSVVLLWSPQPTPDQMFTKGE